MMIDNSSRVAIDDLTLIAYIDGELDPDSCRELELRLADDPILQENIRQLRACTALVSTAFNHALYNAMPDGSTDSAESNIVSIDSRRQEYGQPRPQRWGFFAAAAVLPILLAGGFIGYFLALSSSQPPAALLAGMDEQARGKAFRQGIDREISGTTVNWENLDNGNHGSITPVRTFRNQSGRFCREFTEVRVTNGEQRLEGGIACRQDDGRWRVHMQFYPDTDIL